jgi:transglutaminase-like putative cysteine protease
MKETDSNNKEYLQPTYVINSDHDDIIRFAEEAVDGASDPIEKARRIFYQVRDKIVYDPRVPFFLPEHYRASNVLAMGRGYCVTKACLLCATARAVGIPSRLGLADIRNQGASKQLIDMMGCDIFTFHGYAEFFLNGRWIKATAAFDLPIFKRHNVAPAEFDGVNDVVYPSHTLSGAPYVDYLKYHGSFADLPLEMILNGWKEQYGEDRVKGWKETFEGGVGLPNIQP